MIQRDARGERKLVGCPEAAQSRSKGATAHVSGMCTASKVTRLLTQLNVLDSLSARDVDGQDGYVAVSGEQRN